jgi:hypothetical protein
MKIMEFHFWIFGPGITYFGEFNSEKEKFYSDPGIYLSITKKFDCQSNSIIRFPFK